MISFLVAMDKNNVIGHNNDLPWELPLDLKFFREVTTGHTIIMGRKTFDAIGRILPERKNVILTRRDASEFPEGVVVIDDINEVYEWNKQNPEEEYFVIGGGEVFKQSFPYVDRLYITLIDHSFEGDVYFPKYNEDEWELTSEEKGIRNDENPYDYYFLQYDRK